MQIQAKEAMTRKLAAVVISTTVKGIPSDRGRDESACHSRQSWTNLPVAWIAWIVNYSSLNLQIFICINVKMRVTGKHRKVFGSDSAVL